MLRRNRKLKKNLFEQCCLKPTNSRQFFFGKGASGRETVAFVYILMGIEGIRQFALAASIENECSTGARIFYSMATNFNLLWAIVMIPFSIFLLLPTSAESRRVALKRMSWLGVGIFCLKFLFCLIILIASKRHYPCLTGHFIVSDVFIITLYRAVG